MPRILLHGTCYKAPFEGWYGKCDQCKCEFLLNKGDMPYFEGGLCVVNGKEELILRAKIRCPEYGCLAFVNVSPFVPPKTLVLTTEALVSDIPLGGW